MLETKIIVEVDLVPHGIEQHRERVVTIWIINDGKGSPMVGHYNVTVEKPEKKQKKLYVPNISRENNIIKFLGEIIPAISRKLEKKK